MDKKIIILALFVVGIVLIGIVGSALFILSQLNILQSQIDANLLQGGVDSSGTLFNETSKNQEEPLLNDSEFYEEKTDIDENDTAQPPPSAGPYDTFAKCLTQEGAKFYGASWCPHCTQQKAMFKDSLNYVHYVECAKSGGGQTAECNAVGIEAYPTWIINGQKYLGAKTLEELAQLTGCGLN